MKKLTKIVATISDRRCDVDFLRTLYQEGMDVIRINTAHATPEGILKIVTNARAVSSHIALLIDTKGPEIRTTACVGDEPVVFQTGDRVEIAGGDLTRLTSRDFIGVSYADFVADMPLGGAILIDDGELELRVIEKRPESLLAEVRNNATLGSRKSVNVPGVRINLPSLTERDRVNILLAIKHNFDFIAHSFVRSKQDVLDVQAILDEQGSDIQIIAKIENQEGVDNIDSILEAAYGVMVARGDLGIEVPEERIPGIQRVLVRKCVQAKKPVIVATQMLQSMIKNPRPTRAEVTDIANAIYCQADAVMLSGETASGKYPVESVRMMARVAAEAERCKLTDADGYASYSPDNTDVPAFLAKQAVVAARSLNVSHIITDSVTGVTARILAAFRGTDPVFAMCASEKVVRRLALSFGIFPLMLQQEGDDQHYFAASLKVLLNLGYLGEDDLVAHLSGRGGGATYLEIIRVSDVQSAIGRLPPSFAEAEALFAGLRSSCSIP